MGIHNEAGSGRAKVELPELVTRMLAQMLNSKDEDRAYLNVNSNEVVLLINNLGGVSVLELGGITAEVVTQLEKSYNIKPVRILAGTYMTSLNGLGFSISILNVVNTNIGGPSMIQLLDAPCEAAGWAAPIRKETWEAKSTQTREGAAAADEEVKESGLTVDPELFKSELSAGLDRMVSAEPDVTRFDTVVGDGDCGIGLKRGAEGKTVSPIDHHLLTATSCTQNAINHQALRRHSPRPQQNRPSSRNNNGRHLRRPLRHLPEFSRALPPPTRIRSSHTRNLGLSTQSRIRIPLKIYTRSTR